jgi:hypothetical protein
MRKPLRLAEMRRWRLMECDGRVERTIAAERVASYKFQQSLRSAKPKFGGSADRYGRPIRYSAGERRL